MTTTDRGRGKALAPRDDYSQLKAAPEPARLGQATAVEQSRAIAQVQAAVVMARQFPRSQQAAIDQMRDACGRIELARRAFYKFPRGGETVTGATVYLARELARIWGNIDYGLNELARDDTHGQSEMQAYAWDVETNARSTRTFVVEHARDTKRVGRQKLTELRDIAENNNNFGARNTREMIFAVLPQWFTDIAEATCRKTMDEGGGEPLPVRIDKAIHSFGRARITREQLEERVGRPVDEWAHTDVTDLEILFTSLARREISRDEAFPAPVVTAEDLIGEEDRGWRGPHPSAPDPVPEPDPLDPDTFDGPMFDQEGDAS